MQKKLFRVGAAFLCGNNHYLKLSPFEKRGVRGDLLN